MLSELRSPLWVLELDYCCGQQCMLACNVTAKGLATSAGLQARYRSAAGITAAEALSRVGNFLAVGLPHRIDELHDHPHTNCCSPMSREMALVAYRNLLRSARIAFQGTCSAVVEVDLKTYSTARRHEHFVCRTRRSPQELRVEPSPHSRKRRAMQTDHTRRGGCKVLAGECGSRTSSGQRGQLQYVGETVSLFIIC
jgi:hypothetical protein